MATTCDVFSPGVIRVLATRFGTGGAERRWGASICRSRRRRARALCLVLAARMPRAVVRRAHERAVGEAFGYLERSPAAVRRGRGGVTVHEAGGLVAAAFRRRTSRMGDPQLHTH